MVWMQVWLYSTPFTEVQNKDEPDEPDEPVELDEAQGGNEAN